LAEQDFLLEAEITRLLQVPVGMYVRGTALTGSCDYLHQAFWQSCLNLSAKCIRVLTLFGVMVCHVQHCVQLLCRQQLLAIYSGMGLQT
jgi:hypothetical protein